MSRTPDRPPGESCVVMPFWSQSDAMNFDSNYAYLRAVLPALAERLPDWVWIVLWPETTRGSDTWRWQDDGLFEHERITRAPWPYDTAMRTSVLGFDPVRFHELELRWAPTVYWLHQVEAGVAFHGGYKQAWNVRSRPVLVAQHHYVIHPSLPYPMQSLFGRRWLQVGGSLAAHRVVFNSQHTARMFQESCAELLSPDQIGALGRKSLVLPFGLIDPAWTTRAIAPSPVPRIIYNHRFEGYKHPELTAEVLRQLRARGRKFEVWVTQTVGQRAGGKADMPVDRSVGHPDHATYLDAIAVEGINTLNSAHETYCIAAVESLALGHLLVAPRSVTFPELVPRSYPFLFQSPQEQAEILTHLIDTWPDEVRRWGPRLRTHVRQHFTLDPYATRYAEVLQNAADEGRIDTVKDTTREALDGATAALLSPGSLHEVEEVSRLLRSRTKLGEQACNNARIVRELTERGAGLSLKRDRLYLRWPAAAA